MYLLFFAVSLLACIGGAICGIGGGVIIKPLLDAFGVLSVSTISFLSGCTVLTMSCYSVGRGLITRKSSIDLRRITPLALGAAAGGILGSMLFDRLSAMFADANRVGAIQALLLVVSTLLVLFYTLRSHKIRCHRVRHPAACIAIGLVLGLISAFLGIGGGPLNLMVLHFFFSLKTKEAAQSSLYIILFSQVFALLNKWIAGAIPPFDPILLLLMVAGGIAGGIIGQRLHQRMPDGMVHRLYLGFIVLTIAINIYNVFKFL